MFILCLFLSLSPILFGIDLLIIYKHLSLMHIAIQL